MLSNGTIFVVQASMVGSSYGRIKWPGTNKTLEGTAAAILGTVGFAYFTLAVLRGLAGDLLVNTEDEDVSDAYFPIFVATTMSCCLEAWTKQSDNLFVPLYYFAALRILWFLK